MSNISTVSQLRALYGSPTSASVKKQTQSLNSTYRAWLAQSCFFVIASAGPDGVDCTPRGDEPDQAFDILNSNTILIPDRRGNNRLDTLSNIVNNPCVALLFFIPGIEQTLRVIGRATVSSDKSLLDRFALDGSQPVTCISVTIDSVFFQNNRALARSKLWTTDHIDHTAVPSPGQMIQSVDPDFNPNDYDAG